MSYVLLFQLTLVNLKIIKPLSTMNPLYNTLGIVFIFAVQDKIVILRVVGSFQLMPLVFVSVANVFKEVC